MQVNFFYASSIIIRGLSSFFVSTFVSVVSVNFSGTLLTSSTFVCTASVVRVVPITEDDSSCSQMAVISSCFGGAFPSFFISSSKYAFILSA